MVRSLSVVKQQLQGQSPYLLLLSVVACVANILGRAPSPALVFAPLTDSSACRLPFVANGNSSSKSKATGISELAAADGGGEMQAGTGQGGSAHLDAQSADGHLESEASSANCSQASESSMMSLTSSKASFINNTAATNSTADSGPVSPALLPCVRECIESDIAASI